MKLEDVYQSAIVDYLRAALPQSVVFAIPNAAPRGKGGQASNGVPGLLPGIPDLCVILPGSVALFIEVKTPKGKFSPAQKALAAQFSAMDVRHCVAVTIEDVRGFLRAHGIKTRDISGG